MGWRELTWAAAPRLREPPNITAALAALGPGWLERNVHKMSRRVEEGGWKRRGDAHDTARTQC